MLSDEQVHTAFTAVLGFQARAADLGILRAMGGTPEVLAEYIWDHWLGEPEEPTAEQILAAVREAIS